MTPSPDPDSVYSIKHAQEFLGCISRSKIYEMIADGELETVKVGRHQKVLRRSLVAFLSKGSR